MDGSGIHSGPSATVRRATMIKTVLLYNIDPRWPSEEQEVTDRESRRLGCALRRQGHSVIFSPLFDGNLAAILQPFDPARTIVFNWCESLPGVERSEALVAQMLEDLGFSFTGASSHALRLAYNKPQVKRLLESCGVLSPRWHVYTSPDVDSWDCFPAIVKPAWDHCSVGVGRQSVVFSRQALQARVGYLIAEFGQPALVEEFIDGREFHVPLMGNAGGIEVLPSVEMDFGRIPDIRDRLCCRESKFSPDSEAYQRIGTVLPGRLTEQERADLESVCVAAYEVAGCRDYGRIDVRLRNGVIYVLDVNPNPDLSVEASVAVSADKAGYSFGALGRRIVEMATERLMVSELGAPPVAAENCG